jgi:hypothetical protein
VSAENFKCRPIKWAGIAIESTDAGRVVIPDAESILTADEMMTIEAENAS